MKHRDFRREATVTRASWLAHIRRRSGRYSATREQFDMWLLTPAVNSEVARAAVRAWTEITRRWMKPRE